MSEPIHVNDNTFEKAVLQSPVPVVVDFWAPWCAPCYAIAPHIEKLAREYDGKIRVVKVNTDDNPQWAMRYGVRGIPTVLFVKDGQEMDRLVGVRGYADLKRMVDEKLLGARSPIAEVAFAPGKPIIVTDANFDQIVLRSTKPVLVDFWAEWCAPCHMIAPIIEQLAEEYADRVVVAKLNVDESPMVPQRYGIMGIPTIILFKDGQVVEKFVGVRPISAYRQALQEALR